MSDTYKSTRTIKIPREFNERWVDLVRELVTEIGKDTPRSVKKIIGDNVRGVLKDAGILEKDCVIAFGKTKDDELAVVLFDGTSESEIVKEATVNVYMDGEYEIVVMEDEDAIQ